MADALELLPVAAFRADRDGNFVYVNRAWCELTGLSCEQSLGDGWLDALHPDDRQAVADAWRRACAQDSAFTAECRLRSRAGSDIWVLARAVPLAGEAAGGHLGTVVDDTRSRACALALRESEEQRRRLFEEAIVALFRTRVDGTILAVNHAFVRLLGYDSCDQLVGRNAAELYSDPSERSRAIARYADMEVVETVEARWKKRSGELVIVEIGARRIRGRDGETSHFEGVARDVTEQAQHRAALEVLSTGLALLTGEVFYNEVAAQLAAIVDADVGFVGQLQPGARPIIRTLGLVIDGKEVPPVEYELAGTPCEPVLARRAEVFASGVQKLFPDDRMLVELGAEAYVAVPLTDSVGHTIGHVGVIARKPLSFPERVVSVTRRFAVRISAELERTGPRPHVLPALRGSAARPTIAQISLRFTVSKNEEYIELVALHAGGSFDLKARAHHYFLLLLARVRLESQSLPPGEQGWVYQDVLLRWLRADASNLYLDIYRVRRQLADAGVIDAANIVERRPGTRQIRLGVSRVEIVPLPELP